MPTSVLYKIHEVIFNNPEGRPRGIIEFYWKHFGTLSMWVGMLWKNLHPGNAHLKALSFEATAMDSDSELEFQPPKKKLKTSVMHHLQVVTDKKLAVMSKRYIPQNTKRTPLGSWKVFWDCKAITNVCCGKEGKPECYNDLLESPEESHTYLHHVGLSIKFLQVYIQCYIFDKNATFLKLLDKYESCFCELCGTCSQGIVNEWMLIKFSLETFKCVFAGCQENIHISHRKNLLY